MFLLLLYNCLKTFQEERRYNGYQSTIESNGSGTGTGVMSYVSQPQRLNLSAPPISTTKQCWTLSVRLSSPIRQSDAYNCNTSLLLLFYFSNQELIKLECELSDDIRSQTPSVPERNGAPDSITIIISKKTQRTKEPKRQQSRSTVPKEEGSIACQTQTR